RSNRRRRRSAARVARPRLRARSKLGGCARARRGRGRTAPRSPRARPPRSHSCPALLRSAQVLRTALGIPAPARAVVEDDRVLPALEHELEVAADDGFLRPPAVDYTPLLSYERDVAVVHLERPSVRVGLDARRPRRVEACDYSSFGTSSARLSGTRDQGATSTTVQTEPEPVLARTCRSPSRSRERSSAPAASSSS